MSFSKLSFLHSVFFLFLKIATAFGFVSFGKQPTLYEQILRLCLDLFRTQHVELSFKENNYSQRKTRREIDRIRLRGRRGRKISLPFSVTQGTHSCHGQKIHISDLSKDYVNVEIWPGGPKGDVHLPCLMTWCRRGVVKKPKKTTFHL